MKKDFDVVAVATQLVDQWGDDAPRISKVRLVELIAANNVRAASFWREVMRLCEKILSDHRDADLTSAEAPLAASRDASPPRVA
jgi:hypothetical protein